MKNCKHLLALVLAVLMLLSLAACGSSSGTASQPQTAAAPEASEEAPAAETDWPKSSVEIIVPASAGGEADFVGRIWADALTRYFGVPFVVTNVSGNACATGTLQARDAANDGYTMLCIHQSIVINQLAGLSDYGIEEFEMGGMVYRGNGDLVLVSGKSGLTSADELYEATNANPGTMTTSTSFGASTQILGFMMQDAGFDIREADIGDAAEKLTALLGGHINVIFNSYGAVKDYLETGELVTVGSVSRERIDAYPDIPTMSEQGYDVVYEPYNFLAFPKGTDQAIVDKLTEAAEWIVNNDEEYWADLESYGVQPFWMAPDEAVAYLDQCRTDWAHFYED
ncbi:MAG: tripartite tricarboxylate transporter substrate binding protein [Oscillospiraceae bacterium]|nr:tripartite tricarboxylate transporter substrate binding protein [Oscillospiraceae bacterium]